MFDVTTRTEVDGVLTCRGDRMLRFEAHVSEPATARAETAFEKLGAASIRAGLGWETGKAHATFRDMAGEAKEDLAGSKERGDVYISGKTEQHAPGGISLGLIYTEVDRAFIIVAPSD